MSKQHNANQIKSNQVNSLHVFVMAQPGDGMTPEVGVGVVGGGVAATSIGAAVRAARTQSGTAKRVSDAAFTKFKSDLNTLVGAVKDDQKLAVKAMLIYNSCVHGTGDNAQWERIPFAPVGCKAVTMQQVWALCGGKPPKHFLVHWSQDTLDAFDESPELQGDLKERAVRNGLSQGDAMMVIDFLDTSSLSAASLRARQSAKDVAIGRQKANAAAGAAERRQVAGASVSAAQQTGYSSVGAISGAGDVGPL